MEKAREKLETTMTFRLTPSEAAALRKATEETGFGKGDLIRLALRQALPRVVKQLRKGEGEIAPGG
jgi:hypothetical protein